MKITKDYPGLTRAENGDYILNGDLISSKRIEIDLDNRLVVFGNISSEYGIAVRCGIVAMHSITTGGGIVAGWGICAKQNIEARDGILAGCSIEAGCSIKAGLGITAGYYIEAGTYIDCGKRIFAGTSVDYSDYTCDKTIQCAELRNGTVAYGDLVITKKEETNED